MFRLRRILPLAAGLLCLAVAAPVRADTPAVKKQEVKKAVPSQFLRVVRDDKDQPIRLETSIVRYVPATGDSGVVVDLVGVVHVADKEYYHKLNKQFEEYDVVLYELVAPEGTRIPKGGRRDTGNPLAMMQDVMRMVLELDSQTDHVDYTKKNFVHADLSPEQMAEAMKKRGDNGLTLMLSLAADMLRQQNLQEMKKQNKPAKEQPAGDFLSLLFDPEGPVKMKRMMAEQFEGAGAGETGLGSTLNTILIDDRNEAAMKVFQKELAKGKKKIAIFYGAAHMPDFEKRLKADFGLKKDSEKWLTAWDIKMKNKGMEDLLDLFKRFER